MEWHCSSERVMEEWGWNRSPRVDRHLSLTFVLFVPTFCSGLKAVKINSNQFTIMITTFFATTAEASFNRATAHSAKISLNLLRNMFPGCVISRFGDVHWPPRSPDLNMCDFLWRYMNNRIYSQNLLFGWLEGAHSFRIWTNSGGETETSVEEPGGQN